MDKNSIYELEDLSKLDYDAEFNLHMTNTIDNQNDVVMPPNQDRSNEYLEALIQGNSDAQNVGGRASLNETEALLSQIMESPKPYYPSLGEFNPQDGTLKHLPPFRNGKNVMNQTQFNQFPNYDLVPQTQQPLHLGAFDHLLSQDHLNPLPVHVPQTFPWDQNLHTQYFGQSSSTNLQPNDVVSPTSSPYSSRLPMKSDYEDQMALLSSVPHTISLLSGLYVPMIGTQSAISPINHSLRPKISYGKGKMSTARQNDKSKKQSRSHNRRGKIETMPTEAASSSRERVYN